jgi:zinc protease
MRSGGSKVQRLTLPSGFRLLFEHDPSTPAVAYHLWVGVGSAHEEPHERSVSHFLEHMLFKGTEAMDSVALNDAIENFGGNVNAYTSYEETVYHMVLSSRSWSEGLKILLDMLFHSRLEEDEMEVERQVILEEIKEGDDMLDSVLSDRFFEALYPGHGYGRPIIGARQEVADLSHVDLNNFYRRAYNPGHMVLAAVGNVDGSRLTEFVRSYLGELAPDPAKAPAVSEIRNGARPVYTRIQKGKEERILEAAFPIPGIHHPDLPALDLLSILLGEGELSRLYGVLKLEHQLVRSVASSLFTPFRTGQFLVRAFLNKSNERDVLRQIGNETARLINDGVSNAELRRAKSQLEKDLIFADETAEGRARTLAHYEWVYGDFEEEQRYRARAQAVTEGEVAEVARKYLDPAAAGVAILLPASETPPEEMEIRACLDAAVRRPAAAKGRKSGAVERFTLSNGIRVVCRSVPTPRISGLFSAALGGLRAENSKNNGVSSLIGATLDHGTTSRSYEQIAEETAFLHGELASLVGRNTLGLRMDVASTNLTPALGLFTDVLLHPVFDDRDVNLERNVALKELDAQQDYFDIAAANAFGEAMFRGHPYGLNILGTPESLGRLKGKDLRAHYRMLMGPERSVLSVVGPIDPVFLKDELERLTQKLPRRVRDLKLDSKLEPLNEAREVRRPIRGEKAYVVYGFPGPPIQSGDRYALDVLTAVLASSGGGRLYVRLREELGLLYAVEVSVFGGLDCGAIATNFNTTTDRVEQVLEEIRGEIARLKSDGVDSEELERVKNFIAGNHEIELQRSGLQALALAMGELYGTEHGLEDYTRGVLRVTAEELQEVAQKYLTPEKSVLALLSPGVH